MAHRPLKRGETGIAYDIEEYCSHCDEEIAVVLDRSEKHLETVCPHCGNVLMLCSMCEGKCDWKENIGCQKDKAHIQK